ncbi:MAM and LDL-receptor class A domain-containing protein 2, partial [Caerostris extrusa]
ASVTLKRTSALGQMAKDNTTGFVKVDRPGLMGSLDLQVTKLNQLRTEITLFSVQKDKKAGSEANLMSEIFPPGKTAYCLTFYYAMKGEELGTLKVMRKEENITETTLWLMKGDQGNAWIKGMAILKPSVLYNQVVFRGITGKGKSGYMALDDIRIRSGENAKFNHLKLILDSKVWKIN